MIAGVVREIKPDEARVALVPAGAAAFALHGHTVLVERGAGEGSGIPDAAYRASGAEIVEDPRQIWERADLVVKVKEPLGPELDWMRPGQIVYTYFHLASNDALAKTLIEKHVSAVAYETIQMDDGSLPLLFPMSEVAGRLSIQKGAQCLEATAKGKGILLSGVSGVRPAQVVVLGGGVAGASACQLAVGMGARVSVLDINPNRLRYLHDIMGGHLTTIMSNSANVAEEVVKADLVICAVLIPGARTPRLVREEHVKAMSPGSVILDIAIDQGGACETSRPTTHHDPIYHVHDVVHYCVSNMPGAVPRTSTFALTNATLGYGLAMADKGLDRAMREDAALRRGLNTHDGKVTHKAVAEAVGLDWCEV